MKSSPEAAPASFSPPYDSISSSPAQAVSVKPDKMRQQAFPKSAKSRLSFLRKWQVWGVVLVLTFSGVGIYSALWLLKLPAIPNCPAIFWPTASASLRLYCAQMMAQKRTVDGLLRAIALIDDLPADHPLRPEINHNIDQWSQEILTLAEEKFQQGDLKKAISIAKKVPANTSAHQQVDKQIQSWETLWQRAEGIYADAEQALSKQDLRQAFIIASRLLSIGNNYWETTKYRELNDLITATREDSNKLNKAQSLAEQGGLSNLLEAIKLVEAIDPKSYLYQKAQSAIADFGRSMLDLAETTLDQKDYNKALDIVHQIPEKAGLKDEVHDFSLLAEAQAQAWGGNVADLESAIVQAQRFRPDRPLYGKAQQLISDWQLEIQDVNHLEKARQLAQPNTIADLSAAIAEARQIPAGNPRAEEAQKQIDQWTTAIQTQEDRPILDRADQLASAGDVRALEAAINQASRIQPGRSLYAEADQKIQSWSSQIQRAQDQPLLDQARQLANAGDLTGAVDVAQRISSGRALYNDAQADISQWNDQLQRLQDQPYLDRARQLANSGRVDDAIAVAQQIGQGRSLYAQAQNSIASWQGQAQGNDRLQQAYTAAKIGTPTMLLSAIQIAGEVPSDNPTRAEADRLITRWSMQILQIAQDRAAFNLSEAISIAETIPANTAAYASAQQQIQAWRQSFGMNGQP
jgi:uncharacterized protein (UPF0548 family)